MRASNKASTLNLDSEKKYGETYSQALEMTEYDEGTLRDAKWVSGQYELSSRDDNISWGHHRAALGSIDPDAALRDARGKTIP